MPKAVLSRQSYIEENHQRKDYTIADNILHINSPVLDYSRTRLGFYDSNTPAVSLILKNQYAREVDAQGNTREHGKYTIANWTEVERTGFWCIKDIHHDFEAELSPIAYKSGSCHVRRDFSQAMINSDDTPFKYAISLDGLYNHRLYTANNSSLDIINNFTFEGWIIYRRASGHRFIFNKHDNGYLSILHGYLHIRLPNNAAGILAEFTAPDSFPVGRPVFVSVTSGTISNKTKLFIDGKKVAEENNVGTLSLVSDKGFFFGANIYSNNYYFKGIFDEFRITNVERTENEIQTDYENGTLTKITGTKILYHFNENYGNEAYSDDDETDNNKATLIGIGWCNSFKRNVSAIAKIGKNLLFNSDFSLTLYENSPIIPEFWFENDITDITGDHSDLDSSVQCNGKNSMKLVKQNDNIYQRLYSADTDIVAEKKYIAKVYAKTDSDSASGQLEIITYKSDNSQIDLKQENIMITKDWSEFIVEHTLPALTDNILFRLKNTDAANPNIWFSNPILYKEEYINAYEFEILGDTPVNIEEHPYIRFDYKNVGDLKGNLGFISDLYDTAGAQQTFETIEIDKSEVNDLLEIEQPTDYKYAFRFLATEYQTPFLTDVYFKLLTKGTISAPDRLYVELRADDNGKPNAVALQQKEIDLTTITQRTGSGTETNPHNIIEDVTDDANLSYQIPACRCFDDNASNFDNTNEPMGNTGTEFERGAGQAISFIKNDGKEYIYVFGGVNGLGSGTRVDCYDITLDTWTTRTAMSSVRNYMTIAKDNDYIYIIGSSSYHNTIWRYDVEADSWKYDLTVMPKGLRQPVAVKFGGVIYVTGGLSGASTYEKNTYGYIITEDRWITLSDSNYSHAKGGMVEIGGTLYAFCGEDTGAVQHKHIEKYDIWSDTWTNLTDAPQTLSDFAYAKSGKRLYTMGGYIAGVGGDDYFEYDIISDTWVQKTGLLDTPEANQDHIIWGMGASTLDGKIWCIGGAFHYSSWVYLDDNQCIQPYSWINYDDEINNDTADDVEVSSLTPSAKDYLLIGGTKKFLKLYLNVTTAATVSPSPTYYWFYWNGSGWSMFQSMIYGSGDTDFFSTDWQYYYWSDPGSWEPVEQNGEQIYWIKIQANGSQTIYPKLGQGFIPNSDNFRTKYFTVVNQPIADRDNNASLGPEDVVVTADGNEIETTTVTTTSVTLKEYPIWGETIICDYDLGYDTKNVTFDTSNELTPGNYYWIYFQRNAWIDASAEVQLFTQNANTDPNIRGYYNTTIEGYSNEEHIGFRLNQKLKSVFRELSLSGVQYDHENIFKDAWNTEEGWHTKQYNLRRLIKLHNKQGIYKLKNLRIKYDNHDEDLPEAYLSLDNVMLDKLPGWYAIDPWSGYGEFAVDYSNGYIFLGRNHATNLAQCYGYDINLKKFNNIKEDIALKDMEYRDKFFIVYPDYPEYDYVDGYALVTRYDPEREKSPLIIEYLLPNEMPAGDYWLYYLVQQTSKEKKFEVALNNSAFNEETIATGSSLYWQRIGLSPTMSGKKLKIRLTKNPFVAENPEDTFILAALYLIPKYAVKDTADDCDIRSNLNKPDDKYTTFQTIYGHSLKKGGQVEILQQNEPDYVRAPEPWRGTTLRFLCNESSTEVEGRNIYNRNTLYKYVMIKSPEYSLWNNMIEDSGIVTAIGGNTITDSNKNWAINDWGKLTEGGETLFYYMRICNGNAKNNEYYIDTNTNTILTMYSVTTLITDGIKIGDRYEIIIKRPYFYDPIKTKRIKWLKAAGNVNWTYNSDYMLATAPSDLSNGELIYNKKDFSYLNDCVMETIINFDHEDDRGGLVFKAIFETYMWGHLTVYVEGGKTNTRGFIEIRGGNVGYGSLYKTFSPDFMLNLNTDYYFRVYFIEDYNKTGDNVIKIEIENMAMTDKRELIWNLKELPVLPDDRYLRIFNRGLFGFHASAMLNGSIVKFKYIKIKNIKNSLAHQEFLNIALQKAILVPTEGEGAGWVDGDIDTPIVYTLNNGNTVQVDLGREMNVNRIKLYHTTPTPKFVLEGSIDTNSTLKDWFLIEDFTNNTNIDKNYEFVFETKKIRFVREKSKMTGLQTNEIEIYTDGEETFIPDVIGNYQIELQTDQYDMDIIDTDHFIFNIVDGYHETTDIIKIYNAKKTYNVLAREQEISIAKKSETDNDFYLGNTADYDIYVDVRVRGNNPDALIDKTKISAEEIELYRKTMRESIDNIKAGIALNCKLFHGENLIKTYTAIAKDPTPTDKELEAIATFRIPVGDIKPLNYMSPIKDGSREGTYTIIIEQEKAKWRSDKETIDVKTIPPTASLDAQIITLYDLEDTVVLDMTASSDEEDKATELWYYVDWGDEAITEWQKNPVLSHKYSVYSDYYQADSPYLKKDDKAKYEGKREYIIKLMVMDSFGVESEPAYIQILVAKKPEADLQCKGLGYTELTNITTDENDESVYSKYKFRLKNFPIAEKDYDIVDINRLQIGILSPTENEHSLEIDASEIEYFQAPIVWNERDWNDTNYQPDPGEYAIHCATGRIMLGTPLVSPRYLKYAEFGKDRGNAFDVGEMIYFIGAASLFNSEEKADCIFEFGDGRRIIKTDFVTTAPRSLFEKYSFGVSGAYEPRFIIEGATTLQGIQLRDDDRENITITGLNIVDTPEITEDEVFDHKTFWDCVKQMAEEIDYCFYVEINNSSTKHWTPTSVLTVADRDIGITAFDPYDYDAPGVVFPPEYVYLKDYIKGITVKRSMNEIDSINLKIDNTEGIFTDLINNNLNSNNEPIIRLENRLQLYIKDNIYGSTTRLYFVIKDIQRDMARGGQSYTIKCMSYGSLMKGEYLSRRFVKGQIDRDDIVYKLIRDLNLWEICYQHKDDDGVLHTWKENAFVQLYFSPYPIKSNITTNMLDIYEIDLDAGVNTGEINSLDIREDYDDLANIVILKYGESGDDIIIQRDTESIGKYGPKYLKETMTTINEVQSAIAYSEMLLLKHKDLILHGNLGIVFNERISPTTLLALKAPSLNITDYQKYRIKEVQHSISPSKINSKITMEKRLYTLAEHQFIQEQLLKKISEPQEIAVHLDKIFSTSVKLFDWLDRDEITGKIDDTYLYPLKEIIAYGDGTKERARFGSAKHVKDDASEGEKYAD